MSGNNTKKGISLFVAVLIASVALLFSYAVSNIAFKEILLSQAGRDSQIAFYASNSGAECALYWDLKRSVFIADPNNPSASGNVDITCIGQTHTATHTSPGGLFPPHTWTTPTIPSFFLEGNQNGPCFNFIVIKEWDNDEEYYKTKIESFGHNVCDQNNPRKLERALRVNY